MKRHTDITIDPRARVGYRASKPLDERDETLGTRHASHWNLVFGFGAFLVPGFATFLLPGIFALLAFVATVVGFFVGGHLVSRYNKARNLGPAAPMRSTTDWTYHYANGTPITKLGRY